MPEGSLEDFLKDVPTEQGEERTIDDALGFEQKQEPVIEEEKVIAPRDNRETRRLRKRLEESEKMLSDMNERIRELTQTRSVEPDEVDAELSRIYGTDTPQAQEATRILQKALSSVESRAAQRAREELIREQQTLEAQQQRDYEEANNELDSFLEEIEDEFAIDMTSSTTSAETRRKEFFSALEKYSPKRDGVITDYADPLAVWELVNSKKSTQTQTAKAMASRTMARSTGTQTKADDSAQFNALRDAGIL